MSADSTPTTPSYPAAAFGPSITLADDVQSFEAFFAAVPRTADGQIDIDALNKPPQGDRSAEGLQWNPTLGYHRPDAGKEYWAGKPLTFVKLKQIQAMCDAYDLEIELETMKHWSVSQAKNYFMAQAA